VQSEPGERAHQSRLVPRLEVRVQETDRDGICARPPNGGHDARDRPCAERRLDPAVDEHALGDAEPARARHERLGHDRHQVVEPRPHLTSDREHVFESRRRDERDARAAPLEERVRRDGRAVVEPRPRVGADRGEPVGDGAARIARRRTDLVDDEPVSGDGDQVGEGAAGVRAGQDDPGRQDAAEAGVEPVFDFDSDFFDSDFDSDLLSLLDDAPDESDEAESPPSVAPFFFPSLPARA
jgi:hypothetical protein